MPAVHVSDDLIGRITDPIRHETAQIIRYTLVNESRTMCVQVLSYGCTIFSLRVIDGDERLDEVTLGYDAFEDYQNDNNPYFGATIGRVCNRIKKARFHLNNKEIKLAKNHGIHHLHGGIAGFDKIAWNVKGTHPDGVEFFHTSPEGQEGYPGELKVTVRFSICDERSLRIDMRATTTKPTPVNMTNHTYFNLAGHCAGSEGLYEHTVMLNADNITELDKDLLPTGRIIPVENTAYDFRVTRLLGDAIEAISPIQPGFDINYCVNRPPGLPDDKLILIAKVHHPPLGRWLEVYTNQPGVQFYTANHFPQPNDKRPIIGKSNRRYTKHSAFCLETQKYPDAPNHANFPSIILNPGETYHHIVIYKFGATAGVRDENTRNQHKQRQNK